LLLPLSLGEGWDEACSRHKVQGTRRKKSVCSLLLGRGVGGEVLKRHKKNKEHKFNEVDLPRFSAEGLGEKPL
jgi:hypothetical protein